MIVGVGVDAVQISRFEKKLTDTPKLIERLFSADERDASNQTLAGRFAAKEALIKALAGASGIEWHGIRIGKEDSGRPVIELTGKTAEVASALGAESLHLSITHDGDMAVAFVVAEGSK